MLRKLMKYEFKATGRVFLPLLAELLILSLVNKLLSYLPVEAPQVIGTVISVILMVGIMVLTFVITLQRFRNNLLSNEGHLMMTLPVKTDCIILSKMFVAAIWSVVSALVVIISIVIIAVSEISLSDIIEFFRYIGGLIRVSPAATVAYTIEAIIGLALSLFAGILLLYACMSLSMLVNKRRGLFTFGAFIVITTAVQVVSTALIAIGAVLGVNGWLNSSSISLFWQIQLVVIVLLLLEAVMCAVFFFITRHMLKNRLNLQ